MTLDQLRALCDMADDELGPDKGRLVFSTLRMRKLLAVAEAASNEALEWAEAYCTREENQQRDQAWLKLAEALAALEAAP